MPVRIDAKTEAAGPLKAMLGLEQHLRTSGLDESLRLLVKLRASQMNGCGYCIDMHWKERALGENEQRLYRSTRGANAGTTRIASARR